MLLLQMFPFRTKMKSVQAGIVHEISFSINKYWFIVLHK